MAEVDLAPANGVSGTDQPAGATLKTALDKNIKGRPTMAGNGAVDKVVEVEDHRQVTIAIVGAGQRGQVGQSPSRLQVLTEF